MKARTKTSRKTDAKAPGKAPRRKRTGTAGLESPDKYRQLVELTNTGFVILDEQGTVLDANQEYVRMTGHESLEEVLGCPVTDWTASYDRERNEAEVRKCLATGSVRNLVIDYVHASGVVVPVEINATVKLGPPVRILTVCRDFTEMRKIEQAMRESEDRWRSLVETSAAWIWETDANIRHTYTNAFVTRCLGYQPKEFLNFDIPSLVHPDDRTLMDKIVRRAIEKKGGWSDEVLRWRHKDGSWRHIETSGSARFDRQGQFTGLRGVDRDVTDRERAEVMIRESETRYRTLFESLDAAVLLMRGAVCVDCNPATLKLFGLSSREEIIGKTPLDFAPLRQPDGRISAEVVQWNIEQAQAKGVHVFEWQAYRKSGEMVIMEVRFTPYFIGGEQYFQCIAIDITVRKLAEQELADREALLRQIMDTASVAIFLVDKAGRITHANMRMAEMFGCPMEELIGSEYVAHVHPSEREVGRKKMLALLASELQYVDLERHYWRKDGTGFWGHLAGKRFHDLNGSDIGLIGVITDISERKQAELKLRESESRLRTVTENAPDTILQVDRQGTITFVNRPVPGMTVEQIVGTDVYRWVPPEQYSVVKDALEQAFATGRRQEYESAGPGPNGEVRNYGIRVMPVVSEGRAESAIYIATDITERKQAEEALRESESRTRSIVESLPIGMHLYRLEADGRLVFIGANPAADKILGVDNRIFIGKNIEEAFPPLKDTEVPRRYRDVVRSGKPWQTESIEYKDEAIKGAFEVHAFQTSSATMAAAFEDITDRKRSEAALKQSEEKFRRLYNETPVMLHSIDRDGRMVEVSDHWLKIMGYKRDEVIGQPVTAFYTEASRKYAQEVIQPAFFRNGVVKNVAYQFVKKNGEIVDVLLSATAERDAAGTVVRSQSVIEDVTERKRAEEALRESEARYRALYEGTPVMMHSIDAEGKLVSVSDHWLKKLGYTRGEVLGRSSADFLDEQSRTYARTTVLPDFMRTGTCNDVPYTFRKKNGESISTLLSAIAERDETGRIVRSLAVIVDITEWRKAEDKLRASENMLQTIIDTEPECVKLLDQDANLIMMNRAGLAMLQVDSLDQVKGQCVCPLVTSEYRQPFLDLTRRVFQGESGTLLFEMVGVKGRRLWLETHAVPLRNEKDEIAALLGVTRDVTERKRAEEEARRNEARMTSLYRISQKSVENEQAFLDSALHEAIALTASAIGYLYFYDEAKREFTLNSYSRDVMKECAIEERKTCYELDRTGIWGEAVRQRKPLILNDFEAEHPLKKGYPEGHARLRKFLTVPVIMQGAVVAFVGVAKKRTDYTDADVLQLNFLMDSVWKMVARGRAERALQASEERFRDLAESLPLTIFEMDLQGRFSYVNRAALEKFGYTPREFDAGLYMAQMIAPGDRERARAVMTRRLENAAEGYHEYQGLRKDGTTFPVTVVSGPILRDGRPIGLRGIVMDLSERKQLEDERLKTQKLESLGTLAGGIAHDFNNLLQGVFGYISMAKLTHDQKEKSLAMLEQAEKALHQSVNLTSQLLTFSKGGKPLKKVIDLRPVIENAVRFALSGSRATAALSFADDLRPADADAGQIGQVVQNLVLNADQAMPEGGTVRVSVGNAPSPGLPLGLAAGNYVMISIQDSGVGIPQQYLKKIFDPYFTTKEKGSGLGLATSYSIIKNHGGALDVVSQVGQGSTFTVYLPASEARLATVAGTGPLSCGRTCRILLMDDEDLVRKVAYELLTGLGHSVELAAHGEEAVGKYREAVAAGQPFDVVILDLTIRGGMGGVEALRKLREIDPGVKAIVSSGYSDDAVVANYREHGFAASLKKPYDLTGLQTTLSELLG